jgi:hypothetical protein
MKKDNYLAVTLIVFLVVIGMHTERTPQMYNRFIKILFWQLNFYWVDNNEGKFFEIIKAEDNSIFIFFGIYRLIISRNE